MQSRSIVANLHRTSLALAVVAALCGTVSLNASAAAAFATVAHPAELRQGDAVMGALPMAQPIHIEVALKLRNHDALDAFIANNAKNPLGVAAHPMSREQFLANHAPTQVQAQTVANYLTSMGFRNVVIAPNRLLVSADGTAMTARNAFMTTLAQIKTHDGRVAFANTDDVRIPAALQDSILSVVGLQTVHQAHTFARKLIPNAAHPNTAPTGHYPTEFASIYGGLSVPVASGVTVGIVSEGSLTATLNDLSTFTTNQHLSTVSTQTVNTNGTSSDTSGTGEWDLDSQDIVGMAGGKIGKLIFYNIPSLSDANMTADFNAIEIANVAKIINVSIGECETDAQGDGSAAADDTIFEAAVAQGQTFSISTGDSGADECGTSKSKRNIPSWPAASQYVIAAAGTTLIATTVVSSPSTWSSETVWTDSGGSASTFEPQPSWQTALGVPGTTRDVADIAFDADPNSGSKIIVNGTLSQYGGTSLSAPLFSGTWARVLQQYPGIGFAGPMVYALPASDFHDITSGTNSGGTSGAGYTAAVGYDLASGRGSVILTNIIADLSKPVADFGYSTSGLTANFIDASTDSHSPIASYSWVFGDDGTSTSDNPSHTYAANGTYTVTEVVTDSIGRMSLVASHAITVNSKNVLQLLGNTGFEAGTSPWSFGNAASVQCGSGTYLPNAGSCVAVMNGGTAASTGSMIQKVTIPSGKTVASLAFHLNIDVQGTQSTTKTDELHVQVYDSTGTTFLGALATYSNLNVSNQYGIHYLDMSAYAGQTVKIKFYGVAAGLPTQTAFELDDVSLTVK